MGDDEVSCLFGKATEKQCTLRRADDCGSKGECGVWEGAKKKPEKRTVPAAHFVGTIAVNVDNKKLSDAEFRQFVRNTLPIVIYDSYG